MQPTNPRLLLITKQFFTEGKTLAAYGDNVAVMKAILFLDLAVEQMLNILITDFGSGDEQVRDDMKWLQLWQHAVRAVKKANVMSSIPRYKELKILHEIRNLAQHGGVIPNPGDVSRFVPSVEHMLTTCFWEPYLLRFETFQLWDAVRNPDLKRLIDESQQALDIGEPCFALAGMYVAFQEIVGAIEKAAAGGHDPGGVGLFHTRMRVPYAYRQEALAEVAGQVERILENLVENVSRELNSIRHDAVIANLGVSMAETGKYLKIRGLVVVGITGGGSWYVQQLSNKSEDQYRQDALFALSYVTGLALLAQEVYPDAIDGIRIEGPLTEQPAWSQRREEASSR